jgi:hypothetical protein
MNAQAAVDSRRSKAARRRELSRRPGCHECPFCDASGKCLDAAIKSGRCGDWVWYTVGGKQLRRLWVKPRDPGSPSQRRWRTLLGAASKKYSEALTDKQQDACIAAGAKRRGRPRLGQWGWLTGQQYWVRKECGANAEGRMKNAERPGKGLQTQGISQPTWEPHRHTTVTPPVQRRRDRGRASGNEGRRKNEECRRRRVRAAARIQPDQTITRARWSPCHSATQAGRWQIAPNSRAFPVSRGFSPRRFRGGRQAEHLLAQGAHPRPAPALQIARSPPGGARVAGDCRNVAAEITRL